MPRTLSDSSFDPLYREKLFPAIRYWEPFLAQWDYDISYAAGAFWTNDTRRDTENRGRICEHVNYVFKNINAVTALQRDNAQGFLCVPSGDIGAEEVDVANKDLDCFVQATDFYEKESEAYELAAKGGMAFLTLVERNKKRVVLVEPPSRILLDPVTTESDGSDATFAVRRGYSSIHELKSLFPDKARLLDSISEKNKINAALNIRSWLHPIPEYLRENKDIMVVDTLYEAYSQEFMLVSMEDGNRPLEIRKDFVDLSEGFSLPYETAYRRMFSRKTFCNGTLVHESDGLDELPFVPVVSNYNAFAKGACAQYQSLTRVIMGFQNLASRRQSQLTEIVEKSISSSWIIAKDIIYKQSEIRAGAGNVYEARPGADLQSGIREMNSSGGQSNQLFELLASYKEDMGAAIGVTPAMLGESSGSRETIGLALVHRKWSGSVQAAMLSRLRKSSKTFIRMVLGVIARDRGERFPGDLIELNLVPTHGTETARTERFMLAMEMKNNGIPIPTRRLLEDSPIPFSEEELAQIEQGESEQKQKESQLSELQAAKVQADIQEVSAKPAVAQAQIEKMAAEIGKLQAQVMEIVVKAQGEANNAGNNH